MSMEKGGFTLIVRVEERDGNKCLVYFAVRDTGIGIREEDKEKLREATSRRNLMKWIGQEEAVELPFRRMADGGLKPYTLQTIKTRNGDGHHIVIGVRPE